MTRKADFDPQALEAHLSHSSVPYRDPLDSIDWQGLSDDIWWLPPDMLSLNGLAQFGTLPDRQKRALSRYEFMHILNAGLWLESVFMYRLCKKMRHGNQPDNLSIYHLHELREEAGHSLMFLELIKRSGLERPKSTFFASWPAKMLADIMPVDSLLFWSCVLIGEEIPDRFNRQLNKSAEINPAVHQVIKLHMIDEARHITHARNVIDLKLSQTANWAKRLNEMMLRQVMGDFIKRFYFPPAEVYALAGLDSPKTWVQLARKNPLRRDLIVRNIQTIGRPVFHGDISLKGI